MEAFLFNNFNFSVFDLMMFCRLCHFCPPCVGREVNRSRLKLKESLVPIRESCCQIFAHQSQTARLLPRGKSDEKTGILKEFEKKDGNLSREESCRSVYI